jgi:NurA domain
VPYEGEFASSESLKRILKSEQVKKLQSRSKIYTRSSKEQIESTTVIADIKPSDYVPDFVLAIDGSLMPILVENGFPGAEMGYVTVASVLLNLEKMRELDKLRPANPREVRRTRDISSIDSALPGTNVVIDDEESSMTSLRKILFEVFRDTKVDKDCESLLETYEVLLEYKPESTEQKCPYGFREDDSCNKSFLRSKGSYVCNCDQNCWLFSTDALRIHENLQEGGSNATVYTETMQVWERIWIIHVLRTLEAKNLLGVLKRLAIVVDGPLAVFGHPAWLSKAIYKELKRINEKAKKLNNGLDILLVGIEKTGLFVEHFARLDESKDGEPNILQPRTALLLTDSYIKKNIIFSTEGGKIYGGATYFGRKLFYKTASGARIVAVLPFLEDKHTDLTKAELEQHPRLADALSILDQLASSRYPNSLVPLIEAHAEAAIPLNLGTQILEDLARKAIKR